MPKPTLDHIEQLINGAVLPFYQLERDMALPVPGRRNENDAEHSWSIAFVACCLAPQLDPTLDVGKVSQFALIHDVVELEAGDTSVWETDPVKRNSKVEREQKALEILKEKYSAFPWLTNQIEEYERQNSAEAKFVRSVDKLVAFVIRCQDQGKYFNDKKITREFFDEYVQVPLEKAHSHPVLIPYINDLVAKIRSKPEHFYQPKPSHEKSSR